MRVLVYGLGKTGTTAIVHAIAAAFPDHPMVLEPSTLASVDASAPNLLVKSVRANAWRDERDALARFDRRVLIVRHPLDRLVSHVLYAPHNGRGFSDDRNATRFHEAVAAKASDPTRVTMHSLVELLDEITGSRLLATTHQHAERMVALDRRLGAQFHRLRYEDFVDGRTEALSDYLGAVVSHRVDVRDELRRVERTRGRGDYHRWFVGEDLGWVRDAVGPFAAHFGYSLEIDAHAAGPIAPAFGPEYVARVIDDYRVRFALPRFVPGEVRMREDGARFDAAIEAMREGDRARAELRLVEALELAPSCFAYWLRLANLLSQTPRTDEALFAARRATALEPASGEAKELARRLRARRDREEAGPGGG